MNIDANRSGTFINNTKSRKPIIVILILVLINCALFCAIVAFWHRHDWVEATCTEPMTCAECGATKGEALGHTWVNATCTEPRTCSVCGETEGEPNGHEWKEATCTEPRTCSVCGETEGEPNGHRWKEATTAEPKTCSVCGKTEGEPLGHDQADATFLSAADLGMEIPSDAMIFKGHSYYLYDNDCKNWDDVLGFCKSKGGYPTVINDSEENEVLFEYMRSMRCKATLIGYTDRDTEGIWRWVDGKESDFTDWGTNDEGDLEPNSDSADEDYAQLDVNMFYGHWNDCAFAWDTASFICEWDATN